MNESIQKEVLAQVASFLRMQNGPFRVTAEGWTISGSEATENVRIVERELDAAKEKHPFFADKMFTDANRWSDVERDVKARNSRGPYSADNIILEELAEAMSAYSSGDFANAKKELAQCAAVCIRGMEFIEEKERAAK